MDQRRGNRFIGLLIGMVLGLVLGAGLLYWVQPAAARSLALGAILRAEQVTGLRLAVPDGKASAASDYTRLQDALTAWASGRPSNSAGPATATKPAIPAEPVDRPDPATLLGTTHSYSELVKRLDNAARSGFKAVADVRTGDTVLVTQSFRFQGARRDVSFKVAKSDLVWSTGRELKGVMQRGETEQAFSSRLWRLAIDDPHQAGLYASIASSLRRTRDRLGLSGDEYAELIIAYVQQMPYDARAARDLAPTRYPIVTAVGGTGVCADKSLLLAGLLWHEGYRVALLDFVAEAHMVVGLAVPAPGYQGSGFAFVESTAPSLVGEVGQGYGPGGAVKLTSQAHVTKLDSSGATYGSADETDWIVKRVDEYQRAYDRYRGQLGSLRGDVTSYNRVVAKLNRAAKIINTAIAHPDDREALYSWLEARGAP
jgi:hypothetical protein